MTQPAFDKKWQTAILAYISRHPTRAPKPRALARELDVPDEEYTAFRAALRELVTGGQLALGRGQRLARPNTANRPTGTFVAHRRGFGFLRVPGKPDLYVGNDDVGPALDGDLVTFRLMRPRHPGDRPRAVVERVVQPAVQRWVGVVERFGRSRGVRLEGRIRFETARLHGAPESVADGDLIVVEPDRETLGQHFPTTRFIERLGRPDEPRARVRAVIWRHAIPSEFSTEATDEAAAAAARYGAGTAAAEFADRTDLTEVLTFTIDPVDARDFDDAISLRHLPGGHVELGVHIADVAHFVPPGTALDREAQHRGTSVYLPGFVVPMLPAELSNGVCSLQPGVPRLTLSAFLTYDTAGKRLGHRFARSIIRSQARLTYEEASAMIDAPIRRDAPDAPLRSALHAAALLAKRIRKRRLQHGMIELQVADAEIRLDAAGEVAHVGPADDSFSHKVIEMFMVEANEAVAHFLARHGCDFLRRIHPPPEPDSLEPLLYVASSAGARIPRVLDRAALLELLAAVAGRPEEAATSYVLLRMMAQATYHPEKVGHFALASDDYCHFTSPIRRYPDLTAHRLLTALLTHPDSRPPPAIAPDFAALESLGAHATQTERRATAAQRDAERAVILHYMKRFVGQTFEGAVTGVAPFGVFVQIRQFAAEGLVRMNDLGDAYWEFDAVANALFARTGAIIAIGRTMRVIVAAVDEFGQELVLVPERPAELAEHSASMRLPEGAARTGGGTARGEARPGPRSHAGGGRTARGRGGSRAAGREGSRTTGRGKNPRAGKSRGKGRRG